MDRVKGAGSHAGAITEAPVCTAFRAAVLHLACHDTVLDSAIFIFCLCLFTGTAAFYKCDFPFLLSCIYAHDRADFLSYRGTAYRASADFGFTGHDCRGKAGTSGITASAAVISRQYFQDSIFSLICLYSKRFVGYSEEDADEQSCSADYDDGQNNSYYTHIIFPPISILRIRRMQSPSDLLSRVRSEFL